MSQRYQGGVITKTPVTPSGPYQTSTAPGIWTLNQALQYIKQGIWPTAGNSLYWVVSGDTTFGTYGFRIYSDTTNGIYFCGNGGAACLGSSEGRAGLINTSGVKQRSLKWTGTFSCIPTGTAYNIAGNSSGSTLALGYTANDGVFAVSIDSSNAVTYKKTTTSGGLFSYVANDVVVDATGLPIYAGNQSGDLRIVKLAADGASFSFQKTAYLTSAPSTSRTLKGIALDSSENIHVLAQSSNTYVLKFNSTVSSLTWGRQISAVNGTTFIQAGITVDSSGNVYVLGYTNSPPRTQVIIKYNSSGTLQWSRQMEINSQDLNSFSSNNNKFITTDSSGNIYASLPSTASATSDCIVKYDSSGAIQWQRQFTYVSGGYNELIPTGIRVIGDQMYVSYWTQSGYAPVMWKLPTDGSLTGTYTITALSTTYTYEASSFTESSCSVTESASGAWTTGNSSYTLTNISSATTFSNDSVVFTKKAV